MGPGLTPVSTTRPVRDMQGRTSGSMKSQHWGPEVRVFIRYTRNGFGLNLMTKGEHPDLGLVVPPLRHPSKELGQFGSL